MITFVAISWGLACAYLNAFRGGLYPADIMPFKKSIYVSLIFLIVGWQLVSIFCGLAVASIYFIWSIPPWGRWYTFNTLPRELSGHPTLFERLIEKVSDIKGLRLDWLAFTIRNAICLIPLFLVALFFIPFILAIQFWAFKVVLMTCAYALPWSIVNLFGVDHDRLQPIRMAELITGFLWSITTIIFFSLFGIYSEKLVIG